MIMEGWLAKLMVLTAPLVPKNIAANSRAKWALYVEYKNRYKGCSTTNFSFTKSCSRTFKDKGL